jgi:hypothetical protein
MPSFCSEFQLRLEDGTITHSDPRREVITKVVRDIADELGISDVRGLVMQDTAVSEGRMLYWVWNTEKIPMSIQRKYGIQSNIPVGMILAWCAYGLVLGTLLYALIIDTIRMAGG